MGRFVGFVLGFVEVVGSSLILSLGSLDLWGVRWFYPRFVGFMGCSLDYRFFACGGSRFSSRVLFIGLLLCYNANSE